MTNDQRDGERNGERNGDDPPTSGSTPADGDYGFSGRSGFSEGSYSGAYGRGAAGERNNPSASGVEGAGTTRGGNSLPAPDPVDVEAGGVEEGDDRIGGTGRTGA